MMTPIKTVYGVFKLIIRNSKVILEPTFGVSAAAGPSRRTRDAATVPTDSTLLDRRTRVVSVNSSVNDARNVSSMTSHSRRQRHQQRQ